MGRTLGDAVNDTRGRALAILPWLLLMAGLAWQVVQSVARGHGLLVVLVPV